MINNENSEFKSQNFNLEIDRKKYFNINKNQQNIIRN